MRNWLSVFTAARSRRAGAADAVRVEVRPARASEVVAAAARQAVEALEPRRLMASVAIDVNDTAQTIKGIGGTFAQAAWRDYAQDPVGRENLRLLDPHYVRAAIPPTWEPANDNDSASSYNFNNTYGFRDTGTVTEVFQMLKEFTDAGRNVTVSWFDLPDWMISNPTKENQRLVKAGYLPEVAEMMVAFVKRASEYGARINYLSMNEVNGGYDVKLTAQENADLIEIAGKKLAAEGFGHIKFLVGDTYRVAGDSPEYIRTILEDAGAQPYLGPIAYHSWWSEDIAKSDWQKLVALADEFNKELWCDELNYYALAPSKTPWVFPTWDNAQRIANITAKALTWGGAEVAMYWQYQNDFPLMSYDTKNKYFSFHVVKQFVDHFNAGTQIVQADSDTSSVFSIAGRNVAKDKFATIAINNATTEQSVTFTGLPDGPLTVVRNMKNIKSQTVGTFTPVNGTLTLTVPASSVTTLSGALGDVPNEPPPPPPASLPAGWASKDIGVVGVAGSAGQVDGTWSVKGAGTDIGGAGDDLHFAYRSLSGNGQIVARLVDIDNDSGAADSKAAIMIRESINNGGSRMASLAITPSAGLQVITRKTTGSTTGMAVLQGGQLPRWMKLVRNGSTVTFFTSDNGTTWQQAASTSMSLGTNLFIGLGVSSRSLSVANTATFDNVTVGGLSTTPTPPPATGVVLNPTDDALVRGGRYANTNYGGSTSLQAKYSTIDNTRETYLKFNVSSLGTAFTSAKLRLFAQLNSSENSNVTTRVYKSAVDSWSEGTLTWNNRGAIQSTILGTFTVANSTFGWYEVDLTSFLKKERTNGENLVTLVLRNGAKSNTFTNINSSEHATNPVHLVVT